MSGQPLTTLQVARIVEAVRGGERVTYVAEAEGVSRSTVRRLAMERGVTPAFKVRAASSRRGGGGMSSQTPASLLKALEERDGRRSAWTGNESDTLVPQHRANRGMGGRKSLHRLSNLIWIESDLNGLIESDPAMQAEAVARGIKISGHEDPEMVEVRHAVHGLVLLRDDGAVLYAWPPAGSSWG